MSRIGDGSNRQLAQISHCGLMFRRNSRFRKKTTIFGESLFRFLRISTYSYIFLRISMTLYFYVLLSISTYFFVYSKALNNSGINNYQQTPLSSIIKGGLRKQMISIALPKKNCVQNRKAGNSSPHSSWAIRPDAPCFLARSSTNIQSSAAEN